MAAEEGDAARVKELLKWGVDVDVDAADQSGKTALHKASAGGWTAIVKRLLRAGANIDVANYEGRTPLHFAVHYEQLDVVKLLLRAGAAFAADSEGKHPLHWARTATPRWSQSFWLQVCIELVCGCGWRRAERVGAAAAAGGGSRPVSSAAGRGSLLFVCSRASLCLLTSVYRCTCVPSSPPPQRSAAGCC